MGDFYEDAEYVRQALAKLNALRALMPKGVENEWRVGEDNHKIVDMGAGMWAYIDESVGAPDKPSPLADWICLWNPAVISVLAEVLESHLEGLQHLWDTSPDAVREHIKVSDKMMKFAETLQNYLLSIERVSEDGEWMAPRRRLMVTEWEEDL